MTLPAFTTFCLGIVVEILVLWQQSRQQRNLLSRCWDILGLGVTTEQLIILAVCALAMILVSVFNLIGLAAYEVSLDNVVIGMMFVALGLFMIFYGVVDPRLLPRINEQAALSVHTTVVLGLVLTIEEKSLLRMLALAVAMPTASLIYIGLAKRVLSPIPKALVYLWYLICLFALALQSDFSTVTQPIRAPFTLFDAFMVGASGVFLILHSLFLARFFAIVSSLILPKNRRYIGHAMTRLFDDTPMPRWQLFVLLGLAAGVLLLDTEFDFTPSITVVNAVVLIIVQILPQLWRLIQAKRRDPS